jgi:aminopeptidase N
MFSRKYVVPEQRSRTILPAFSLALVLIGVGAGAPAAAAGWDHPDGGDHPHGGDHSNGWDNSKDWDHDKHGGDPHGGEDPTTPPVVYLPGAPGIGDPYFPLDGNGGYDVAHYSLDLSYEPATDVLSGTATISATSTENLSSFNLDLDGLTVESVTVNGEDATWTSATTEISIVTGQPLVAGSTDGVASPPRTEVTVQPAAGLDAGSEFTTVVEYSGVPVTVNDVFGAASGVIHTDDGMLIVGQPRVAATWFPANDHPADKASFDFRVSVPEGLQVVANGALIGETVADGRSVWEWVAEDPMAPYLATASVGNFTVTSGEEGGVTYLSAIDPDLLTTLLPESNPTGLSYGQVAQENFTAQPEVVEFLSEVFGPYPFDQAGGIADDTAVLEFALENQTRPIYPLWAFEDPADPSVVVHELAHQWYGDSVAIERWSDIWLNEGFATYAEWLWEENAGGATPQEQFDLFNALDPTSELWGVEVANPGAANIFSGAIYVRGAMTLQALRTEVGDDAFFEILLGWAQENAGGNVTTSQFTEYAEQVSGQDLDALFDTWIYTPDKPAVGPAPVPAPVPAPAPEPAPAPVPEPEPVPAG